MCTPAVSDKPSELEVLVATMGQHDLSLARAMNLQADAVIGNQCGTWGYTEQQTADGRIRMISTGTRGVGVNRNLAIQLSRADILLFADDDVVYYDGALQAVKDAFDELPEADVIFFGMDMTRNGQVFDKRRNKVRRIHLWNALKYGAARMAVRREAILKKRVSFSNLFGGGCIYCCGEDTIFIRDCLKAGLRLYSHSAVLGRCAKDSSTWFSGFNDKYFFDRGAMLACAFPVGRHLLRWYYAVKLWRRSGADPRIIARRMGEGMKAFGSLAAYPREDNNKRIP